MFSLKTVTLNFAEFMVLVYLDGHFINRVAMGRARFMFCTLFIYFFLVLWVTRPRLPLGQILNHATCDVYLLKAVETLIHGQCYGCCFLLCVKYIFFWFYRSIGFKGNNKYGNKRCYVSHGRRGHYSFHFLYVTNKIAFTLQVYFARSDGH